MRVLVTGGAGYIGGITAVRLVEQGHEVEILDDLSTGHRSAVAPEAKFHQGSLNDPRLLDSVFRSPFDAVLHFAAFSLVGESVREPLKYFRNNVGGTLDLLDRVAAGGAGRLVFSSSAAVYGEPDQLPIPETAGLAPVNPYGRTKVAMEWALADLARSAGIAAVALRYFNAAGATERLGEDHRPETHLIPLLLRSVLDPGIPFRLFGDDYETPDGTCIRDYIHVSDLAEAHLLAVDWAEQPGFTAMNLGTEQGTSVLQILAAVERITGHPVAAEVRPRRPGDPARLVATRQKALRLLGWQPRSSDIGTIVTDAWNWHRTHRAGYGDSP